MKRMASVAAVLCTAALVALGAALPGLAVNALDRQLERESTERDNGAAALALGETADLLQMLDLFGSSPSEVELAEGVRLDEEGALQAAEELIDAVGAKPFAPDSAHASPVLITGTSTGAPSGIVWICTGNQSAGDAQESVWIDDASGKAVAFFLQTGNTTLVVSEDGLPEEIESLLSYYRENGEIDSAEASIGLYDELSSEYAIELKRTDENTAASYTAPALLMEGTLLFNLGWQNDALAMPS